MIHAPGLAIRVNPSILPFLIPLQCKIRTTSGFHELILQEFLSALCDFDRTS